MKRVTLLGSQDRIIGLFALLSLSVAAPLSGQYAQQGNVQGNVPAAKITSVVQAIYDFNSPAAPVQQVQFAVEEPNGIRLLSQSSETALHEPMPLKPALKSSGSAAIPVPVQVPAPTPNNHYTQFVLTGGPQFEAPKFSQGDTTPIFMPSPQQPSMSIQPQSAPLPVPQSVPAAPARQVAVEAVTKNHKLKNISAQVFEKKLTDKLGSRFVPVRNVENTGNLSRFRLPVQDGTDVELSIDIQNGITTVIGSAPMVESCLQIVNLLDSQENAEFLPVQRANVVSVKKTAQIVNQTVNQGGQKVAQINPIPRLTGEQPTANSGGVLGPVQIDIIDGLDTMVIRGTPKDVAAIQNMLKQIETMSLEHEPIIELVPLQHADSYRVSTLVQQLYSQVYLARRGGVTMLPLIKPNTILIAGKQESINAAKELIAKLDTAVAPDAGFQIFRLKHASSDTLATQITQSFTARPGYGSGLETQLSVVSDFRTNALIVQASPRDVTEIASMIQQLDTDGSDITNLVKPFPLKNAMASELATTLQNTFSGSASSTGGGFSNTASSSGTQQRGSMVTLGELGADGNLKRSNVLYDVKISADTRSNTLLVMAPSETMPLIEAIVHQLDQLPSAESKIKVFVLKNADAYSLTTMLTNLFASSSTTGGGGGFGGTSTQTNQLATVRPGIEEGESTLVSVRFQCEPRTNSIVACGTAGDMAVVEALLIRFDEDNANNRKVSVFQLINTPAEEIAPVLQQYVTEERTLETQSNTTEYRPQSPQEQYRKELVIVAEPISNRLIISTTPRYYNQIKKIIQELDERPLMLSVQVLIAEVRLNSNKETGVELGLQDSLLFDRAMSASGAAAGLPGFLFGSPTVSGVGLPVGNIHAGTVGTQGITSLGTGRAGSSGIGGFTFSASSESVSVLIRALETKDKLRVLSKPQLTMMHNKRATVKVGQEIPFVTSTNNSGTSGGYTSQTDWMSVGTILDLTPRIMPDGTVAMAVYVERSSMGSEADGVTMYMSGDNPVKQAKKNSTNAQTTISAMDGQTVVFAGLITEQKETVNRSIPFLNKIPVIKHFFEYDSQTCNRTELLIVMTPTIIRTQDDLQLLKQQETSRMHWCINDVVRMTGNSNMRLRSDEWTPDEIRYRPGQTIILNDSQLPAESEIPVPTLAPAEIEN